MLTSKEIREYELDKAVFGGYDLHCVDSLLDDIAADFERLERENEELRAKNREMTEQIEEYHRVESGIRETLVTAQSYAENLTKKASADSDNMISRTQAQLEKMKADATAECEAIVQQYRIQARQEKAKLELAQRESASFIAKMTKAFQEQSISVSKIPERAEVELEIPAVSPTVQRETLPSRVEKPAEPNFSAFTAPNPVDMPNDILKILADAKHESRRNGMEQSAFNIELTGSGNHE